MRIISKQKDFYDMVQKHGVDHDDVLIRNERQERHVADKSENTYHLGIDRQGLDWDFTKIEVGFAGLAYPCVRFRGYNGEQSKTIFAYSIEHVLKFYKVYFPKLPILKKNPHKYWDRRQDKFAPHYLTSMAKYFATTPSDRFEEWNCISYYRVLDTYEQIEGHGWSYTYTSLFNLDCPLRPVGFERVMDPYTAYQELYMFHANRSYPAPEMVEVSDIVKRDKQGFDKYSFKTPPGKKKRRKNKKVVDK